MSETSAKPIRKEIYLSADTIAKLQEQADAEKRSLKNYMETVLIKKAK